MFACNLFIPRVKCKKYFLDVKSILIIMTRFEKRDLSVTPKILQEEGKIRQRAN